ncbi:hypothetical protein GWO43_07615 [candidate division KSB1 bacterium]|nr:hypothetical protein [candidate division KSB1 bacterium]NIR72527.1 hypothetical protein [candidate division KSB1 bacterium]NIS23826.1 hypothetical protein [candidate division KSB1 bacterium]NIT70753.1 hypothetical protein [candidate division KSB1 bacterium]NIU24268.1 hypothetical protein [candidate division KSB1 bacterium]
MYKLIWLLLTVILMTGCERRPDLVVTKLERLGLVTLKPNGNIELPVSMTVSNQGTGTAKHFGVVTEYIIPDGTFEAGFVVNEYDDQKGILCCLDPEDQVELSGWVTIPAKEYGRTVAIKAKALCCSEETGFSHGENHIEEMYVDNNESLPIQVSLARLD